MPGLPRCTRGGLSSNSGTHGFLGRSTRHRRHVGGRRSFNRMARKLMRHVPMPRLLVHRRRIFRSVGRAHRFLRKSVRHSWRTIGDSRRFAWMPGRLMRHVPMCRLLLHRCSLLLSGNGLANLRGSVLWHSVKSAHTGWALDVFLDVGVPLMGTWGHCGKFNYGHGCISVPAPMLLPRRHLVRVHALHLPLRHRQTTGLLHLGAGRPSLLDKRMAFAMAGHDLSHVHAVLEDRGLPRRRRIDMDVARTYKLVCIDEDVAGGAEAVAGITVAIHAAANTRLGRQWRPAHAIGALTPRDPRRSPLAARHPDPAITRKIHPAAIMIGGPAKRLVRLPGPAERRPDPATIQVRSPALDREGGLPAVAVAIHLKPAAVECQRLIEQRVVGQRCSIRQRRGGDALRKDIALKTGSTRLGPQCLILLPQGVQ